ncbi:MAG: KH domain-containing protein [Syntrophales bacterium]|nr:KH domain-containing protein [Syntrophales bacterium]MDY0044224.1 KH domain-containing protein [Syntrophales bacterium]
MMVKLIRSMAEALVGNPGEVQVLETRGGQTSVYELSVAKEDLGRIIGKRGQTVKSIRTILNAVSSKSNKKVVLEIVE